MIEACRIERFAPGLEDPCRLSAVVLFDKVRAGYLTCDKQLKGWLVVFGDDASLQFYRVVVGESQSEDLVVQLLWESLHAR